MQSNVVLFSGHHHLKKLVKQGSFKKISKATLLSEVRENLARHRLQEKLFTKETSKEKQAFVSKTDKLKIKFKESTTNDNLTRKMFSTNLTLQSPTPSPLVTRHFRIERVRQATLVKPQIGGPRDSDEVVDDEDAFTRDKLKDKMLLENLTTEPDPDSDEPATDNSDENGNEGESAPGHVREVGDRDSDDEEKDDEDEHDEDKGGQQVHKEEHEIPVPPENDSDNDDDEDKNEEEEDGRRPGHSSEDEEQPLHSLKKFANDKNHKITPYEISDVMSQELMRIYGGNEDQTAAMIDRERHLEALNRLRVFSARLRQKMLQTLRPSYPNTPGQNAALLPQFYILQTLGTPRVPVKTSLFSSPTASMYRPSYMDPRRSANLQSQSPSNQGYSINVDGLHGVFSKSPGFVVKFHSPNSEVTVVKKGRVVNPMTTTRVLQIDAK